MIRLKGLRVKAMLETIPGRQDYGYEYPQIAEENVAQKN
jgi:hypothetical protein